MAQSVAVVIDAGYVLKLLDPFRSKTANNRIEVGHLRAVADRAVESGEELFRIYCYHCPPYGGTQRKPFNTGTVDFGASGVAKYQTALQESIRLAPRFAFRTGQLRWRGWKCGFRPSQDPNTPAKNMNWRPEFEQKQVDIKIGLDIAWLASKSIAEIIAIASNDTDFVPAMKFARREGVQVRLLTFAGVSAHNNLVGHSDYVTEIDLEQVAQDPTS
ncbi:MAG: NYN domain-containing protein [bacterium]